MRARNIKPGFFKNEHLLSCDPLARILFEGLWCMADREGRLEDRPNKIKIEILPCDNSDVNALLDQLAQWTDEDGEPALIMRYQADGKRYIQIVNFLKHQNPHVKEAKSSIPAPCLHHACTVLEPDSHHADTVQTPEQHSTSPADSLIPDSLIPESKNSSSHPSGCDKGGGGPVEAEKTGEDLQPPEPEGNPEPPSTPQKPHVRDAEALRLAKLLRDTINGRSPGLVPATTNMKAWAKSMRLMIERDKRTPADIEAVIRWCQSDPFWCSNILSAVKLREKFGQLWDRMHARAGPSGRQRTWMDELNEEETHAATGV